MSDALSVVHVYDGHEQVYEGKGSVPGVVWNVARATAEAGHDVTVIERQWDGLPERAVHEGVRFRRLSLWTGADEPWTRVPYEQVESPVGIVRLVGDRTYFALRALAALRSMDVDVVHVHLPFAANVLTTVAPWIRDRMVYTAHLGELRLDALQDAAEDQAAAADGGLSVPSVLQHTSPDAFLAERVAKTTVLNPDIREAFEQLGVPESKLAVVPNGVDIERFAGVSAGRVADVRERYDLDGRPALLFVGTVMPRKGVTDLVEAVASVVDRGWTDLRLVIAGDTDLDKAYVGRVEKLIDEHSLATNVDTAGFVPAADLPALYQAVDLTVIPSLEEGFGMTAVESLAAGTPVVGTRVGGIPWVLDGERCGLVTEPGDPDVFGEAIATLLEEGSTREAMAEAATERARSLSWAGISEDFISVYREVEP